jgi:hypothetical protein
MREFHTQILGRAARALTDVPRERRFLQATVAAVPARAYQELVEAMREFQTRVSAINNKYDDKTEVIAFAMQAFPLSLRADED